MPGTCGVEKENRARGLKAKNQWEGPFIAHQNLPAPMGSISLEGPIDACLIFEYTGQTSRLRLLHSASQSSSSLGTHKSTASFHGVMDYARYPYLLTRQRGQFGVRTPIRPTVRRVALTSVAGGGWPWSSKKLPKCQGDHLLLELATLICSSI